MSGSLKLHADTPWALLETILVFCGLARKGLGNNTKCCDFRYPLMASPPRIKYRYGVAALVISEVAVKRWVVVDSDIEKTRIT
eukprot:746758-Hanusia_phi.AAC.2